MMENEELCRESVAGVEGEMTIANSPERKNKSTLDEPVRETVIRDLKAVGIKFFHVLYPRKKETLLKDWDLWGPLFLCIFFALTLRQPGYVDSKDDNGLQFAEIFLIVLFGSIIVTLNSKLIGGHISFFQSVCVLGYCMLAPLVALLLISVFSLLFEGRVFFVIKCISSAISCGWATLAATMFLGDSQPPKRRTLAVYPIFIFYFVITLLVMSSS